MTFDIHSGSAFEQYRRQFRLDPHVIHRFRRSLLRKFESDAEALCHLPTEGQPLLHCLTVEHQMDSQVDGATRLLLRTPAGHVIECVILRIASGRSTLCVSCQAGCAAACDFCATGKLGIAKNLSAAEILDQVIIGGQILAAEGRRLDNIVFMGMGEPFHNPETLTQVLRQLIAPTRFARAPSGILVSTVGIPERMIAFAEQFPDVKMALSLHSADSAIRKTLIPLEEKHPLGELKSAVQQVNRVQGRPLMVEYLMLKDMNDSEQCARQLTGWLAGLNVRVNLIPFNPITDAPHLSCSPRDVIQRFAQQVRDAGYETTVRYSLGSDIAAACGQLARTLQPEN